MIHLHLRWEQLRFRALQRERQRNSGKLTSEAAIPLEVKEPKRPGRPRQEQKKSRRSQEEKDLPTRRRDNNDSDGEGNMHTDKGSRNGTRKVNRKEKLEAMANSPKWAKKEDAARNVNIPA